MKKIFSFLLGLFLVLGLSTITTNFIFAQGDAPADVGVNVTEDCLMRMGQNCFHYEKIVGIDDDQPEDQYTATSIAQDVVVSATYMVGTVLTVVILICGLGYIFASSSGKDPKKYKDGLKYAAIGAVLVRGAYAIVRLIQYIARGQ